MKKHRLRDISIGKKIPVLICTILTLLVGVSSAFLYRYYLNISSETVKKSMESIIRINEGKVTNLFETIFTAIDVVNNNNEAYQIPFGSSLSNIADQIINYKKLENQSNLYDNTKLINRNQRTFRDLFMVAQNPTNEIMSVSLLVPQDYPITHLLGDWSRFEKANASIEKSTDAEQTDWYKKAVELEGDNYWFTQDGFPDRIFLAKMLTYRYINEKNEYSVRQLGVIVIGISMQWVDTQMQTSELTEGTQIYLTDDCGRILYAAGEITFSSDMISDFIVNEKELSQYQGYNEAGYLIQKYEIGHGLFLLTAIPYYDLEQMAFQMVQMILIVMVVVLLFGITLMTILSRWMLNPVVKLSEQMEKGVVETVDVSFTGKDEIGRLYQSYNSMQQKIQELIKKVWDQAEKQKNAEIHALQMQINPHFTFNTLSAIGGLALLSGQDQIAEQLKLLSDLMRYYTRNPDGLVPLQTEISMIQKYEEIQHFSFDNRFTFCYQIMPECEKIMIPKLIIQPLVENTIIHSRNQKGEGAVTISARLDADGCLIICVTDDGRNVDTEQINRYIRGENVFETDKESFGIRNVYDRLRLIFGDKGNLEYRHTPAGNTEAVVTISIS